MLSACLRRHPGIRPRDGAAVGSLMLLAKAAADGEEITKSQGMRAARNRGGLAW